jgi:hypothetical protein
MTIRPLPSYLESNGTEATYREREWAFWKTSVRAWHHTIDGV